MYAMNTLFRTCIFILCVGLADTSNAEQMKLGVIVPLSGSAVLMGDSLRGVVELANLKHLRTIFEDDRCDGKTALSAYLKLRNEGVHVFYMACSGSILAVAPQAKRNGDLILTTYAGSSKIRESGDEVIRLNPDAISIADGVLKLLSAQDYPTAILYEEQEYASSMASRLAELLGAKLSEKISYLPDAESFNAEILRIKQKKVKSVIFVPVGDAAARVVLRQLSQNGVEIPVIGEVNLCDYPFKPSEYRLHGKCVAARFEGPVYSNFLTDYHAILKRAPAYPFYDAMALDLFKYLDSFATQDTTVPQLKKKLLSGFDGAFAKYRLSPSGEAENGGDYLTTTTY